MSFSKTATTALIQAIQASPLQWIPFSQFMNIVLYGEGGYYNSPKNFPFGPEGDFVTAPTLSLHLAEALIQGWSPLLQQELCDIIELGAGDGTLASQLCRLIEEDNRFKIRHYKIHEISPHLKRVQAENLKKSLTKEQFNKIQWLDVWPSSVTGIVFGNEVIDAIPCERIHWHQDGIFMEGCSLDQNGLLCLSEKALSQATNNRDLIHYAEKLFKNVIEKKSLPYRSELHTPAEEFFKKIACSLDWGLLQIIDYGFEESVYYMPSRSSGTIMCHHQQHTHSDVLYQIGEQDISVHVNFSRLADVADQNDLVLQGYLTQSQFLVNTVLKTIKKDMSCRDKQSLQILTNPHEMGELFKTIAWVKDLDMPFPAFSVGDKSYKL